jgi:hypothetical protein
MIASSEKSSYDNRALKGTKRSVLPVAKFAEQEDEVMLQPKSYILQFQQNLFVSIVKKLVPLSKCFNKSISAFLAILLT